MIKEMENAFLLFLLGALEEDYPDGGKKFRDRHNLQP